MKHRSSTWSSPAVGLALLLAGVATATYALAAGDRAKAPQAAPQTFADAGASGRRVGYAPDPPPLREAKQFVLTLRYERGEVRLLSARRLRLRRAVATPRRVGRYALELLSGPTVVDRLRFDFPLLGAQESAGRAPVYHDPPRFESHATVTYRVMVPDSPRVSRARLVDRATGASMMIPWPPDVQPTKAPADAGLRHAGRNADAGVRDAAREADAARDARPEAGDGAPRPPDAWNSPDAPRTPDARPMPRASGG